MDISVVTLLWRNERFAEPFVSSLAAAADRARVDIELVALENGPEGAAAAAALEREVQGRPRVNLVALQVRGNLGFAGGMNLGASAASGEVLVIANLDLEFDVRFFEALQARADVLVPKTQPAFVAPAVGSTPLTHGGDASRMVARDHVGVVRRDWLHRPSQVARRPEPGERVAGGNGACIVLGRSLLQARFRAVGGLFDAEYHSFYEDVDLFWWAARSGIPVRFFPDLQAFHHQGGSFEGKFRFRDRTPEIRVSVMANYRLTVWKNASSPRDVAGWLAGEAGYTARCLALGARSGIRSYLASWRLAISRARAIRARRGQLRTAGGP